MIGTWKDSFRFTQRSLSRRFVAAAGACLVLGLITGRPLHAQNPGTAFNISGTAGFETGLQALAYIEPPIQRQGGSGVNVNWGDSTGGFEGLTQTRGSDHNYWVYGTHLYARPGTYAVEVSYDWESSCGFLGLGHCTNHALLTATATISPPGNFVILSIGDSVASGEGNPSIRNRSGLNGKTVPAWSFWDDAYSSYEGYVHPADEASEWPSQKFPCHRSGFAGPAQAANTLVASNPDSHITFIHYACSGATIEPNDTAASAAPTGWVEDAVGQLKIARKRLSKYDASIDILLISAGSNSMYGPNSFGDGFGGLVKYCLKSGGCYKNAAVQGDLNSSFRNLPTYYKNLAMEINCQQPPPFTAGVGGLQSDPDPGCTDSQKQIPKLVLITEYMDPTHDEDGNFPSNNTCGPAFVKLTYPNDLEFFYNGVVKPLNDAVNGFPADAQIAGLTVPTYSVMGIGGSDYPNDSDDFLDHGVCAGKVVIPHVELKGVNRWVNNGNDSIYLLGEGPAGYPNEQDCGFVNLVSLGGCGTEQLNGMLHPNSALLAATLGNVEGLTPTCPPRCGQEDYRDRIDAAIVKYNPPVTTASATVGGAPYLFGTWTNQSVDITLSANNAIKEAGVGTTYYAVDQPNCAFDANSPQSPPGCLTYSGPFTISDSGQHNVTFFSVNLQGNPEAVKTAQAWIDVGSPLQVGPGLQIIHRSQNAVYNVTVGHTGWDGPVVILSCETDAPQATCSLKPDSVSLDAANTSTATVAMAGGSMVFTPSSPARPTPFGPLAALRVLLALATVAFLAAMALALRRRRWAYVGNFAALTILFGLLLAGCASTGKSGTPGGTYDVYIKGTSGSTSHTAHVIVVVQ
jgi:hypothetical protein